MGKARHEYYVQGPGFLFPYDHTEILALETFFFLTAGRISTMTRQLSIMVTHSLAGSL